MDVDIFNPNNMLLQSLKEESFGDRVIDLIIPGDYLFCFNNKNSFASKAIDFDITVSSEDDWGKSPSTLSQFEKALSALKTELRTMQT